MTPRHRAALVVFATLCCAALAPFRPAAAQAPPVIRPPNPVAPIVRAQPEQYLLVTDVADARAIFVNPAGLARGFEASLGGFITAADSSSGVRASQYGALLASRGAAFGWQHDDFASGQSANMFVAGLGLGSEQFALGGDHKWYTGGGGPSGGAWEAAAHYRWSVLDLAAVWRNIGSPRVRDSILEETLTTGAAIDVWRRARISAEWHVATSGFPTRFARAGIVFIAGRGMLFSVIGSFSSNPELRGMSFAVQLSAPRFRAALFDQEPSATSAANQFGAAVSSVTPAPAGWNTGTRQEP